MDESNSSESQELSDEFLQNWEITPATTFPNFKIRLKKSIPAHTDVSKTLSQNNNYKSTCSQSDSVITLNSDDEKFHEGESENIQYINSCMRKEIPKVETNPLNFKQKIFLPTQQKKTSEQLVQQSLIKMADELSNANDLKEQFILKQMDSQQNNLKSNTSNSMIEGQELMTQENQLETSLNFSNDEEFQKEFGPHKIGSEIQGVPLDRLDFEEIALSNDNELKSFEPKQPNSPVEEMQGNSSNVTSIQYEEELLIKNCKLHEFEEYKQRNYNKKYCSTEIQNKPKLISDNYGEIPKAIVALQQKKVSINQKDVLNRQYSNGNAAAFPNVPVKESTPSTSFNNSFNLQSCYVRLEKLSKLDKLISSIVVSGGTADCHVIKSYCENPESYIIDFSNSPCRQENEIDENISKFGHLKDYVLSGDLNNQTISVESAFALKDETVTLSKAEEDGQKASKTISKSTPGEQGMSTNTPCIELTSDGASGSQQIHLVINNPVKIKENPEYPMSPEAFTDLLEHQETSKDITICEETGIKSPKKHEFLQENPVINSDPKFAIVGLDKIQNIDQELSNNIESKNITIDFLNSQTIPINAPESDQIPKDTPEIPIGVPESPKTVTEHQVISIDTNERQTILTEALENQECLTDSLENQECLTDSLQKQEIKILDGYEDQEITMDILESQEIEDCQTKTKGVLSDLSESHVDALEKQSPQEVLENQEIPIAFPTIHEIHIDDFESQEIPINVSATRESTIFVSETQESSIVVSETQESFIVVSETQESFINSPETQGKPRDVSESPEILQTVPENEEIPFNTPTCQEIIFDALQSSEWLKDTKKIQESPKDMSECPESPVNIPENSESSQAISENQEISIDSSLNQSTQDVLENKNILLDTSLKQESPQDVPENQEISIDASLNQSTQNVLENEDIQLDTSLKQQSPQHVSGNQEISIDISLKQESLQDVPGNQEISIDTSLKQESPQDVTKNQEISIDASLKQITQDVLENINTPLDTSLKQECPQDVPDNQGILIDESVRQECPPDLPENQEIVKREGLHDIPENLEIPINSAYQEIFKHSHESQGIHMISENRLCYQSSPPSKSPGSDKKGKYLRSPCKENNKSSFSIEEEELSLSHPLSLLEDKQSISNRVEKVPLSHHRYDDQKFNYRGREERSVYRDRDWDEKLWDSNRYRENRSAYRNSWSAYRSRNRNNEWSAYHNDSLYDNRDNEDISKSYNRYWDQKPLSSATTKKEIKKSYSGERKEVLRPHSRRDRISSSSSHSRDRCTRSRSHSKERKRSRSVNRHRKTHSRSRSKDRKRRSSPRSKDKKKRSRSCCKDEKRSRSHSKDRRSSRSRARHRSKKSKKKKSKKKRKRSSSLSSPSLSSTVSSPIQSFDKYFKKSCSPKRKSPSPMATSDSSREDFFRTQAYKIKQKLYDEFKLYEEMPELHPQFKIHFENFVMRYKQQYPNLKDEKYMEETWLKFWGSVVIQLKKSELEKRLAKLGKVAETVKPLSSGEPSKEKPQKRVLPVASTSASTSVQSVVAKGDLSTGFTIEGTIELLEQLMDKLGSMGLALKALIAECRSKGTNTPAGLNVFVNHEGEILMKIVKEKIKGFLGSSSVASKPIYKTICKWIEMLMDCAKKSQQTAKSMPQMNLKSIARITQGKEPAYILQFIKNTYAYHGKPNISNDELQETFFRVCAMHFEMSYKPD